MSSSVLFTRDRAASRPFVTAMSVIGSLLLVSAAVIASSLLGQGDGEGGDTSASGGEEVAPPGPMVELEMEAEALRLENELLRESGQRIEANGGAMGNRLSKVPPIDDPEAAKAVNEARKLRTEGDMAGALSQLRTAQQKIGEHPRILYAMADVYQAMGLTAKATAAWEIIREIGPSAGDYYEMAILRLGYNDPAFTPARPDNALFIGRAGVQEDGNPNDGERVIVRLSLQSRNGMPLNVPKVYIDIQFYDLINGRDVDVNRTKLDADSWTWVTQPIDWREGEELLDIAYFLSEADAKRKPGERRQFYGFVAKLYYEDELQDVYMHPRTLHEDILRQSAGTSGGGMENSLFPDD